MRRSMMLVNKVSKREQFARTLDADASHRLPLHLKNAGIIARDKRSSTRNYDGSDYCSGRRKGIK